MDKYQSIQKKKRLQRIIEWSEIYIKNDIAFNLDKIWFVSLTASSHESFNFYEFHSYLYNSLEVKGRDTIQSGSFRI